MKLVLLGIAAVLALILLLQWQDWQESLPEPRAADLPAELIEGPSGPPPSAQLSLLRPEDEYLAVTTRPLFLPDRRPVPEEPNAETPDLEEEIADLASLDVTATLILSPSEASVWLRDTQQRELVRLRLGDRYQGWQVAQINGDHILLERQGVTEKLQLLDFSRPNVQPRRPARALPPGSASGRKAPGHPRRD